jgi:hypothetical protein
MKKAFDRLISSLDMAEKESLTLGNLPSGKESKDCKKST